MLFAAEDTGEFAEEGILFVIGGDGLGVFDQADGGGEGWVLVGGGGAGDVLG